MSKDLTKSKKGPWIPPGKCRFDKKSSTSNIHPNYKALTLKTYKDKQLQSMQFSKVNLTFDVKRPSVDFPEAKNPKEENLEEVSIQSCSSFEGHNEVTSIYLHDIKEEYRMLNLYYMSLRPVSQFLNRSFNIVNIEDATIKKLLSKVEVQLNNLFSLFEDLEFSISLFENALFEGNSSEDLSKIINMKESLLKKLLECYTDILTIFQVIFDELSSHNTRYLEKERNIFLKRYEDQEKKYLSQASTLKDLERRISILQGKYRTVEGYNTTLEETKNELQKLVHSKDSHIRSLNSELTKFTMIQEDEKCIELMEEIKNKAHNDKKLFKKALKGQKLIIDDQNKALKMCEEEKKEKTNMIMNLAAERDQLRAHLAAVNNEVVQARYQIEEIKSQKLKLQNELTEYEISFKNQHVSELENLKKKLSEKEEIEKSFKKTIKNLEKELKAAVEELEASKSSQENIKASLLQTQNDQSMEKVFDEVRSLTSLLQDTKKHFQNIQTPDTGALSDNIKNGGNTNLEIITTMMHDMKKELLELKKPNLSENPYENCNEPELVKQLEEYKRLHNTLVEENAGLKAQLKYSENASNFPQRGTYENYPMNNIESNLSARELQLQLALKNEEIWKYKQREKKLEYQLDEVKDKLQKKEMESARLFTLEESLKKTEDELRAKKLELSLLEQKKQEESERLLNRAKDLQEALDEMTAKNELLHRHIDMIKDSLFNVFGDS